MARIPSLKRLWRIWLRNESPRRQVLRWSRPDKASIFLVCVLVAFVSSWPWLGKPNLWPGVPAPFEAKAPTDALVIDTESLEKRRSQLIPQVIDSQETNRLRNELERQLKELELVAKSNKLDRLGPVNISYKEQIWLRKRNQEEKLSWENEVRLASRRMLSQGLVNNLAVNQLRKAASLQLAHIRDLNLPAHSLGVKLLSNTFQGSSNLKTDLGNSQQLIEELINAQGRPTIEVNKGDLIISKGERITKKSYDVLNHFGMISRSPRPAAWFSRFSEASISCVILLLIMRREKPCLQARHGLLALGLLLVSQISNLWLGTGLSPLAVVVPPALLLSQGIGSTSALAWVAIEILLWPLTINGLAEERLIVAFAVSSIVALQAGRMRSRAQLLQMAVLLPFGALLIEWILLRSQITQGNNSLGQLIPNSEVLITEALLMGITLMLTILLIPILESTFGLITKARLMELADQERPLLRRLSSEAPGTFEHTLMLCGLAEEGARTIGADVDLIRTGALYHDIGKLHAPEWFIENQQDGKNPHDQIDDPFISAEVLQAHVDEGLKLARKYRLPSPIADFIPEHQGTLKMGYFLHRAREKNPNVSEHLFRYKGPVPRSRETGILMLADGCEAALRALHQNSSNEDALVTIRKIVESRRIDGQLKNSTLSRAEVELVVIAFANVWKRMKHRRIAYPITTKKGFPA